MRLVFFIDNTGTLGGGEYAQFKFAQYLARRGHQVVVFAGDKHFLSAELSTEPNLVIRYRRTIPILIRHAGLGLLNACWSRLYELVVIRPFIKVFDPDWLVGYLRYSAVKATRLGNCCHKPVANFIFENPQWMHEQLGERWEAEWAHSGFRRSWGRAQQAYAASTVLIPNSCLSGVKCREWLPQAKVSVPVYPGVEPAAAGADQERIFDLIYVGRLNALKNIDDLLHAAARLKSSPRIVIVGGGEELASLQASASRLGLDVTFAGLVTDEQKWSFLRRSKVMVFPTSFEGFGMPPLEALLAGCQVVCSDIPILREVYGSQVHYFPLHDTKKLAVLLEKLLSGKGHKRLSAAFAKRFSWEYAAKTIETVLVGKK